MAMCGQELEQMSSVDQGSQYSLSDGILPSLGAASRNHRKPKLRRFIISPFDPHYKSLSLSISLSVLKFRFWVLHVNVFTQMG